MGHPERRNIECSGDRYDLVLVDGVQASRAGIEGLQFLRVCRPNGDRLGSIAVPRGIRLDDLKPAELERLVHAVLQPL